MNTQATPVGRRGDGVFVVYDPDHEPAAWQLLCPLQIIAAKWSADVIVADYGRDRTKSTASLLQPLATMNCAVGVDYVAGNDGLCGIVRTNGSPSLHESRRCLCVHPERAGIVLQGRRKQEYQPMLKKIYTLLQNY